MANAFMYRQGQRAALVKLGYYDNYGYQQRDYLADQYHRQMLREMEERKELERLQGRIHRNVTDDVTRQNMFDAYVQERADAGREGGQFAGGLLGALGGGMLGHALHASPAAALGGAGLGGLAGYHLGGPWGESAGREAGEDLVERAHAASLAPGLRNG